ncbi:hypothetical protein [Streptomyces sp. MA5143a]|uniref:hypothetical protein n=1 Tax=Streptomyces sp. MA5143a TaxID=2083010 RepID=UPI0015E632CE|nr:hypothetical protein [Streptomyces sp. MA5143a]
MPSSHNTPAQQTNTLVPAIHTTGETNTPTSSEISATTITQATTAATISKRSSPGR